MLFVCSGNICRSPMAAELFRAAASRHGGLELEIGSGGTLGIEGCPASPEAIDALREAGVELGAHRSRGVDPARLACADVVVVMAREHLRDLAAQPSAPGQERWLLRAFEAGPRPDPGAPDLDDPIGHPLETYRAQVEVIRRCAEHLVTYLVEGR